MAARKGKVSDVDPKKRNREKRKHFVSQVSKKKKKGQDSRKHLAELKATKTIKKKKKQQRTDDEKNSQKRRKGNDDSDMPVQACSPQEQARWFTEAFKSAQGSSLSVLELSSPIPAESMVTVSGETGRDAENVTWHLKLMFGDSWERLLSKGDVNEDTEKGSPALLILCSSAVRCGELLKGLKDLTKDCKPAKLFAKHLKIQEQVEALKAHVNIAVGTPNRVKKLIDIGALGVERLSMVLLDLHEDAKKFTLFTVPQVKVDFWDLYRVHFHHKVMESSIRLCLF